MKTKPGSAAAVIDFSGVLSPGAAAFSRPQNLQQALLESGLAKLGLDQAAFWSEIIEPTWHQGSTTTRGYRKLLGDAMLRLAASRGESPAPAAVFTAVDRFTAAYLRHSAIDRRWAPVLDRLIRQKVVVIATDHYAEATAQIIAQLSSLGLAAVPALASVPADPRILVANSADLGAPKKSAAFWKTLLRRVKAAPAAVLLVDDFGSNEQPGDSYGRQERYLARKEKTAAAIESAWGVPVEIFPFLLQHEDEFPALVNAAARFLLG
ncbi:MAG: hypothetical protein GYA86_05260 [Firmicutes bacterium]|nr:hypothetical protein [Bacillota bacterium]